MAIFPTVNIGIYSMHACPLHGDRTGVHARINPKPDPWGTDLELFMLAPSSRCGPACSVHINIILVCMLNFRHAMRQFLTQYIHSHGGDSSDTDDPLY